MATANVPCGRGPCCSRSTPDISLHPVATGTAAAPSSKSRSRDVKKRGAGGAATSTAKKAQAHEQFWTDFETQFNSVMQLYKITKYNALLMDCALDALSAYATVLTMPKVYEEACGKAHAVLLEFWNLEKELDFKEFEHCLSDTYNLLKKKFGENKMTAQKQIGLELFCEGKVKGRRHNPTKHTSLSEQLEGKRTISRSEEELMDWKDKAIHLEALFHSLTVLQVPVILNIVFVNSQPQCDTDLFKLYLAMTGDIVGRDLDTVLVSGYASLVLKGWMFRTDEEIIAYQKCFNELRQSQKLAAAATGTVPKNCRKEVTVSNKNIQTIGTEESISVTGNTNVQSSNHSLEEVKVVKIRNQETILQYCNSKDKGRKDNANTEKLLGVIQKGILIRKETDSIRVKNKINANLRSRSAWKPSPARSSKIRKTETSEQDFDSVEQVCPLYAKVYRFDKNNVFRINKSLHVNVSMLDWAKKSRKQKIIKLMVVLKMKISKSAYMNLIRLNNNEDWETESSTDVHPACMNDRTVSGLSEIGVTCGLQTNVKSTSIIVDNGNACTDSNQSGSVYYNVVEELEKEIALHQLKVAELSGKLLEHKYCVSPKGMSHPESMNVLKSLHGTFLLLKKLDATEFQRVWGIFNETATPQKAPLSSPPVNQNSESIESGPETGKKLAEGQ